MTATFCIGGLGVRVGSRVRLLRDLGEGTPVGSCGIVTNIDAGGAELQVEVTWEWRKNEIEEIHKTTFSGLAASSSLGDANEGLPSRIAEAIVDSILDIAIQAGQRGGKSKGNADQIKQAQRMKRLPNGARAALMAHAQTLHPQSEPYKILFHPSNAGGGECARCQRLILSGEPIADVCSRRVGTRTGHGYHMYCGACIMDLSRGEIEYIKPKAATGIIRREPAEKQEEI